MIACVSCTCLVTHATKTWGQDSSAPRASSCSSCTVSTASRRARLFSASEIEIADYAKHFTCISLDPRGAGETDKPAGAYSMEMLADDVAASMHTIGVERAHVSGVSFGAATGSWLAGKYPQRVKSLSLHSC